MLDAGEVPVVHRTRNEAAGNGPSVRRINEAARVDGAARPILLSSAHPLILRGNAAPDDLFDSADAGPAASAPEIDLESLRYGLRSLGARTRRSHTLEQLSKVVKRASDVVIAGAIILLTMPIFVAAAVAICATSPGSIFYLQERCGRNGRLFKIIKFRSMVSDADQRVEEMAQLAEVVDLRTTNAPMFKCPDDPRVTKIGRLIRRTNVDELPQLFNVIVGHMSLVGPRPLVPEEVASLAPPAAQRRHSVRPGLTCFWQVLREEDTTFEARMQLDLLYVTRRSSMLDLALIALTPFSIVRGNGSY